MLVARGVGKGQLCGPRVILAHRCCETPEDVPATRLLSVFHVLVCDLTSARIPTPAALVERSFRPISSPPESPRPRSAAATRHPER